MDKELCASISDWQKAFDLVKRTKLMQILKKTGIDWRETRLISKLYTYQSVKVRMDQEEARSVETGRGVSTGCCLSLNLFHLQNEYLPKVGLEASGDLNTGGQVIRNVKHADDFVLLAKEERLLQGMFIRPTEIGRCYGMDINVEKIR